MPIPLDTEIRAAKPGEVPYRGPIDKDQATVDLVNKEAGKPTQIGQKIERAVTGRTGQAITEGILTLGFSPAYNAARGIMAAAEPSADVWTMIHESAMKGILEPDTLPATSVSVMKAYPGTDWRFAAAVGTIADVGMMYGIPKLIAAGQTGLTELSRDRQLTQALNAMRKEPSYYKNLDAMVTHLEETGVQPVIASRQEAIDAMDKAVINTIWQNRGKYNYFKLIGRNLERASGVGLFNEVGQANVVRKAEQSIIPTFKSTEEALAYGKSIVGNTEKIATLQAAAGGLTHREIPEQMKKWMEKGIKITERQNPIKIIDDEAQIKDISGKVVDLPKGHEMTPYKLSNGKIWLHDGKDVIVESGQLQNLANKNLVIGKQDYGFPEGVEEVVKGGDAENKITELRTRSFQLRQKAEKIGTKDTYKRDQLYIESTGLERQATELESQIKENITKFSQYQLPGGENYREVLIKAPWEFNKKLPSGYDIEKDPETGRYRIYRGSRILAFGDTEEQAFRMLSSGDLNYDYRGNSFKSSHWDEPNVLAHIRMNDRTTPDGKKVLFIEEIQSDWAREGRKKGFIGEKQKIIELPNNWTVEKDELSKKYIVRDENRVNKVARSTKKEAIQAGIDFYNRMIDENAVPSHPSLKDWQSLALKRILKEAVDGGYDAIAWTTGEQQAARYDLSKQINSVHYVKQENGQIKIRAYPINDNGLNTIGKTVPENEVEQVVGKDLAHKIINGPNEGMFSGMDLKIGGEWAKSLYDRQIPNILKDLTKGETKQIQIDLGGKAKKSDAVYISSGNLVSDKYRIGKMINGQYGVFNVETSDLITAFDSQEEAISFVNKPKYNTQPSIAITPELKARVLGQPAAGGETPLQDKKIVKFQLNQDDIDIIDDIYKEVLEGQPGKKILGDPDSYAPGKRLVFIEPSTYPPYFQNKGYTKKNVLGILKKSFSGELTEKQKAILDDLIISAREYKDEERKLISEGVTKEEIAEANRIGEEKALADIKISEELETTGSEIPPPTPPPSTAISGEPAPEEPNKPIVNLDRLNIPEESKQFIQKNADTVAKEIEKRTGNPVTFEEVIEAAKQSQLLSEGKTREATLKLEAEVLRTRQHLSALATNGKVTKEYVDTLKNIRTAQTSFARLLGSQRINADPVWKQEMDKIIEKVLESGAKIDDVIAKAEGVDFQNPQEATKFYREFIKPTLNELASEYRYINMLSSPLTHIVNAFSNLTQVALLRPVTMLYRGTIDNIAAGLFGKEREHYINEVPAYTRGVLTALPDAFEKFNMALKGTQYIERPDVPRFASGNKVLDAFQIIPKLLEASDVFFRTLAYNGEIEALAKKGITGIQAQEQALEKAKELVFRKDLDSANNTGQGSVLTNIDKLTAAIYQMRGVPGVDWFIPFVQTPMNIAKQMIEYSPYGVATLPGNKDKVEQLAKVLIGSTVFAMAGYIAMTGDSTWSAPVGEKQKEQFYGSGKRPYSLKVFGKWVSFQRLGTLSFSIALAAAYKYHFYQSKESQKDDITAKWGKFLASGAQFFANQTYMQGMGNMVDAARGDMSMINKVISNFPSQLIPLAALQRWVNNIIDPVFRKPKREFSLEGIIENMRPSIIGASFGIDAYTDSRGNVSRRQYPILNALSPVAVSRDLGRHNAFSPVRTLNRVRQGRRLDRSRLRKRGRVEVSGRVRSLQ